MVEKVTMQYKNTFTFGYDSAVIVQIQHSAYDRQFQLLSYACRGDGNQV
jgi:hypothetical protein